MKRTLIAVATAAGALSIAPALADHKEGHEEGEHRDLVVLTGGALIDEDDRLHYVVVFDGDVTLEGTVHETLLVFQGNVTVSGTVEDVIALDGDVTVASGGGVVDTVFSDRQPLIEQGGSVGQVRPASDFGVRGVLLSLLHVLGWDRSDLDDAYAAGFTVWIPVTVSLLLLGALLLWLAPRGMDAVAVTRRESKGASALWGVLLVAGLPSGALLIMMIVVGITIGLGTLLALGLLYALGYVAGSWALGRWLVGAPRSRWLSFLAGLMLLRLIALIPVAGAVVTLMTVTVGLGLLAVTIWRARSPATPAAA